MRVANRYIWLFGTKTSEVWYDAGTFPFPFTPHPAGIMPYGVAAAFTPAVANGVLYWLASGTSGAGQVLRATGFTPEIVSTFPLRHQILNSGSLTLSVGDQADEEGHTFYLLTIPGAETTFCYDVQENIWSERATWISELRKFIPWRPRWHAYAFGEHRWLDAAGGKIYRSDQTYGTDVDSREIRRVRRAPTLLSEQERLFFQSFELELDRGLGLAAGQGSDPQVMLRWSNDGGNSWSSEQWRSAGKTGEYNKRVIWNRLGSARRRVFEISTSDPIPWRVINAYIHLGQTPKALRQAS